MPENRNACVPLTFKKSLSHKTSGFGSPITSHMIMTVSPSKASLERGLVINNGSFEYLDVDEKINQKKVTKKSNTMETLTVHQVPQLTELLEFFCHHSR